MKIPQDTSIGVFWTPITDGSVIAETGSPVVEEPRQYLGQQMIELFREDNPKFDSAGFCKAANLPEGL